jgi:HEAT repeat protein
MGARVMRLMKIHAGEERVAARMLLFMLTVWMAATIGASGIESLLFSRYGTNALPYLYIVLGFITLPVMARLGAMLQRSDRLRILTLLPLALGITLMAGRALLLTGAKWVYPVLWLLMMGVWIMEATGAWAVAALVNDTRQAKRLFPLYGAGQIVGGATGGLLTVPLARLLHAENLIFVWALVLIGASFLVRSLLGSKTSLKASIPVSARRTKRMNVFRSVQHGLALIRSSLLLGWLAIAMILFALLYNALSFIFAEAVAARFPDTDSLAAFIGLFNALINGAGLIVSLFIANRLFAKFGVATMVLTLAVVYLAGFTALSIASTFTLLVAFRLTQMVWVNGVWITGWQALFTIVPPERRGQVTSFMDGAAWEGGMMLAGGAIILAENFRGEQAVSVLGIVGAALLILAMWRARHAYGPAVAEAVRAGRPDVFKSEEEPFGGFRSDASALATLQKSVADEDPNVRRVAIAIAAALGDRKLLPAILKGATDADPEVSAEALHGLARHPDPSGSSAAVQALSNPDARVRASAVDALVACSSDRALIEARLRPRLRDPDPEVRAHAAVGLVRVDSELDGAEWLAEILQSSDSAERAAAVVALGELRERADLLERAAADANSDVRLAAVTALGRFEGERTQHALISALGDSDVGVRAAAITALESLGAAVVKALEDALMNPRMEQHALRVLSRIRGADPNRIRSYAHSQVISATHYGRLAQALADDADERVVLLAYSLKQRSVRHATNALWANVVLSESDRIAPSIESLASRDPSQRANALEALETLGEPDLVRPLLAVWETASVPGVDLKSEVGRLLTDDDPWLRACSVFVCRSVLSGVYDDRLRMMSASDPDPDVRAVALLAIEGDKQMETLKTMPLMERILFLRKVPLFAELAPADLKNVAKAGVENLYSDGEMIAAQGEPGGTMHVVVKGVVEVDMRDDEREVELARRGPGEVVGEMSLITGEPRMASLVASGEVRTLSIDRPRFHRILTERPEVSLAVMRQLCIRLVQSRQQPAPSH